MTSILKKRKRFSSFQLITLGFSAVILIGTVLLMMPVSSQEGIVTSFPRALFTATSAVCVTGLVVCDTASYWSFFGQIIILILIQIGGLGIVTVAVSLSLLSGKKISLMQRSTMQEAIAAPKVGGIVRLTGFILKTTVIIELIGALIMMPVFCKEFRFKGIWMALFHSISAFCNAGFDILGSAEVPYASLSAYRIDPVINFTIMILIIIGGIGFLTWEDIEKNKFHFKHYRMQSKAILITTGILIIFPALFFYFYEFSNSEIQEGVLVSLFQSVTTRTAGFNTADLVKMSSASHMLMIILMLIGGSPGSTAGGMKTTTIAVLLSNAVSTFNRKEEACLFHRRIESSVIKNASTILVMYLSLFLCGAFVISIIENLPLGVCLFETASAVGTVGLTLGITPDLGCLSQFILILLMFFGRVGGLTLIYAAFSKTNKNFAKLPQEKITVG